MEKSDQLLEAIHQTLDPEFRLLPKESTWLGRAHSWVFGKDSAVILGHTCYAPQVSLDSEVKLAQLLAHEGTHLAQKRDEGAFWFAWKYGLPQSQSLIFFGLAGLCFGLFGLDMSNFIPLYAGLALSLTGIIVGVNFKRAQWRIIFELEAYATSWWALGAPTWLDEGKFFHAWVDHIYELLNKHTYLYCGRGVTLNVLGYTLASLLEKTRSETNENTELIRWHRKVRGIFLA